MLSVTDRLSTHLSTRILCAIIHWFNGPPQVRHGERQHGLPADPAQPQDHEVPLHFVGGQPVPLWVRIRVG